MNNRGRQFSKNAQGRSGRGKRKGNLKWLSLGIVFMVLVIAAPLMINGILSNMGKALMVSAEEHLPAAGAQPDPLRPKPPESAMAAGLLIQIKKWWP